MEMKMTVDLFDKCKTDQGYFGPQRYHNDHYFTRPILPPRPDRVMEFQGKDTIMWSVNNYLGLANHPAVNQAAQDAIAEFGVSAPMGSRMMTGNSPYHLALEKRLAEVAQKEASFLFNYGYLGVVGTIASLVGPDDVVVMDKLAHACIVDGAFQAAGQVRVFKHNNMQDLEKVLKRINENRKGGILIVTEGVFGMTGDVARLDEIVALKDKYGARLFVDDAHGWGVMGEIGRGTADFKGVQDGVDIYFGTFAKSFGAIGGFSAANQDVIDWITYNARTQVFAKSLPMVYVQALDKTLDLVVEADDRRRKMWENSNALKQRLRDHGYFIGPGESPICSVFVPIRTETVEAVGTRTVSYLRDNGVFVTAITYPVIPHGLMMFRMIPTAEHLPEDIEHTAHVFGEMREALGLDLTIEDEDAQKIRRVYGR